MAGLIALLAVKEPSEQGLAGQLASADTCDFSLVDPGFDGASPTNITGRIEPRTGIWAGQQLLGEVAFDVINTDTAMYLRPGSDGSLWTMLDLEELVTSGESFPGYATSPVPVLDPVVLLRRAQEFGSISSEGDAPTYAVALDDLVPPDSPPGRRLARDYPAAAWDPVSIRVNGHEDVTTAAVSITVTGQSAATLLRSEIALRFEGCNADAINIPTDTELRSTMPISTPDELRAALTSLLVEAQG